MENVWAHLEVRPTGQKRWQATELGCRGAGVRREMETEDEIRRISSPFDA
jgi:hypothetical protein